MNVIETFDFSQDIKSIKSYLSSHEISMDNWQKEPFIAEGSNFIKYKPILDSWRGDRPILDIFYSDDNQEYFLNDTVEISGKVYSTEYLLRTVKFVSKKVNSILNTSVDVTFSYDKEKQHTITLQDWAFWRTLSDEECLSRLKKQITKKDKL